MTVYLFRDRIASRVNTVVCIGEKERIEESFRGGQLVGLFDGEIVYTNDTLKKNYVGVWGTRNASRLRRLLREKGVEILIQQTRPPGTRLRSLSIHPSNVRK
jgi:hypothetical protein